MSNHLWTIESHCWHFDNFYSFQKKKRKVKRPFSSSHFLLFVLELSVFYIMKNYRVLAFLLLVLILETTASPESTGDVESTSGVAESKPDVIIKLIKRGAAVKRSDSSQEEEPPRDKRRSSSKKNKGRKVGKK